MKKNRVFDLKFEAKFKESFSKKLNIILKEGFLTNYTYCRKLENTFSKCHDAKYSTAVNSGTGALDVVLRSINIKNKKVLIASNTFIATAIAVENSGGIPEMIDIENKFYSLCPDSLKKRMNKNIGAVIIIHIAGLISPRINEIVEICKKYGVPLIEDCSQAHFSHFNNKYAGSFGLAGTFSFYTTKNITSGEGGIILTNNKKFHRKTELIRQFGYNPKIKDDFLFFGSNYKLTELNAAFALSDLERSKMRLFKRNKLAKRYQDNLQGSKWLCLKPKSGYTGYYKQIIISPVKRKFLENYLRKNNIILTGGVYNIPLHRQSRYKYKYKTKNFENSNFFSDYHFCPPCFPEIKFNQVDYICEKLLEYEKNFLLDN
jgi:perosamine synthetase